MKHTIIAALAFSLAVASASHAQTSTTLAKSKDAAVAVQETEAVVTVVRVDPKERTVTFRGPKGGVAKLTVPPESQNLDQVKPGQQYRMKYVEAVALEIRKGGAPSAVTQEQAKLAPKGAKPGGVVVRTQQISGVIDAVDYTSRYIAVRGPKGNTVSLKVADGVKLEELSAGDRIVLTHTEALAIEMVAQPKKAPAKKSP